jgi:F-type H+-transporting ATPase subunit alpha
MRCGSLAFDMDDDDNFLYDFFQDGGLVVSISDGIVGIQGLDNVANGEVIEFLVGSKRVVGMVLNLEPQKVSAVVLGEDSEIKPGQFVVRKFDLMGVPTGESLLGRVVDPIGNPIDRLVL